VLEELADVDGAGDVPVAEPSGARPQPEEANASASTTLMVAARRADPNLARIDSGPTTRVPEMAHRLYLVVDGE
jgi:hypothetical protein